MEPIFRTLEIAAEAAVKATGTPIIYRGLKNIPHSGGAVVAINRPNWPNVPAGGRRAREQMTK
jgi:hypothetical protein